MLRYLSTFCALVALTACATPEQIAQQKQLQAQQDYNDCAGYGLRPGTKEFAECRMQLDLARRQPPTYYYSDPGPRIGLGYYHFR